MSISVSDPFNALADPALPSLVHALNPDGMKRYFRRRLSLTSFQGGPLFLRSIRVTRHKPGKRCLIEYDVVVGERDGSLRPHTVIGKIRARRFGAGDLRLLRALWDAGFAENSPDGISVPRPLGLVPSCEMWLQLKVRGEMASRRLAGSNGIDLARRIAEAAWKLHRASVPTTRRHSMADELTILHRCLRSVAEAKPRWRTRLEHLGVACERLAAATPEPAECGIHRDFYADQVIVDGPRLHLIDFDLYCRGDPGLDIGNFLGHLTEQSLRCHGDPAALADREAALEERFVELSGEAVRPAVRAYALLTLVRHVYLSSRFPDRAAWTERLLELCEERLDLAATPLPFVVPVQTHRGGER